MATNQFKSFALGGGANVLSPAAYAALTTLLANGYLSGEAISQQINTTLRQASYASVVLGLIVNDNGVDALDNGNPADLKTKFLAALEALIVPRSPVGSVLEFAGSGAPPGRYLVADGTLKSRTTYAALFGVIGTIYNTGGEPGTDFRLPDYRGMFLRGADSGRGVDPSRGLGNVYQLDQNKAHSHTANVMEPDDNGGDFFASDQGGDQDGTAITNSSGGTEARPVNMAVRIYIAY